LFSAYPKIISATGTKALRVAAYAVAAGAACAIVTTSEITKSLGFANPVTVKVIQICASHGWETSYRE